MKEREIKKIVKKQVNNKLGGKFIVLILISISFTVTILSLVAIQKPDNESREILPQFKEVEKQKMIEENKEKAPVKTEVKKEEIAAPEPEKETTQKNNILELEKKINATFDNIQWKTFSNTKMGFSFEYPSYLDKNENGPLYDDKKPYNAHAGLQIAKLSGGFIGLNSKKLFEDNLNKCLSEKDGITCIRGNRRASISKFFGQIDMINDVSTSCEISETACEKLTINYLGCYAIGGAINKKIIRGPISNIISTVQVCGYDVHFNNFIYYAVFPLNKEEIIEIRLPLFGDSQSDLFHWAEQKIHTCSSELNCEKNGIDFANHLREDLKDNNPPELIKKQLEIFEKIAQSIQIK